MEADAVDAGLQAGTGRMLQLLLEQSKHLNSVQDDWRKADEIADLRNEVLRLRQKKSALAAKLSTPRSKTLRDSIIGELSAIGDAPDMLEVLHDVTQSTEDELAQKRHEEVQIAYRLAGTTVFKLPQGRLGIRLETFFLGKYFETYYVILAFDAPTQQFSVYRHTIPFFIPLDALAAQHLNKDVKTFVTHLSDYVNALVARREQLKQFVSAHAQDPHTAASANQAFDCVDISTQVNSTALHVRLVYENALQYLPNRAHVTKSHAPGHRLTSAEELFCRLALPDAFVQLATDL